MKILITGCKGQLGNELIKTITEHYSSLGKLPESYINSQIVAIDIEELDISLLKDTVKFISDCAPDIIINCAAMTNVNGCETNLDLAYQVNAIGARNLAISAEKIGSRLIHISTDYVFDGNATKPYVEWDLCNPQSIYGKSKLLGEQYVKQFCSKSFIIRTSWLYGYVGNNFVKTMIKLGREKSELKVVNDQFGNPTCVTDLVYHILKLGETEEYGLYHCTGEGECSWYDFAKKIMNLAQITCDVIPCTTEDFPSPAKRPAYSSLDNMMLRNTVGNNMREWSIALKEFMKGVDL